MIKARFQEEQPELKIVVSQGKIYVFVCRNGEKKSEEYMHLDGEKGELEYWEYDYIEGVESLDGTTEDEIRENIDFYIEKWSKPEPESNTTTLRERVSELEKKNDFLTNCLLEMSETVYS